MGLMAELSPNTHKRLKILEPIALPVTISAFCLFAAEIVVASSGSEVPTATSVTAIRPCEIFIALAITTAPSTTHLPPRKSPTVPAAISREALVRVREGVVGSFCFLFLELRRKV